MKKEEGAMGREKVNLESYARILLSPPHLLFIGHKVLT